MARSKTAASVNPAFFYVDGPVAAFVRFPVRGAGPFWGPDDLINDPSPIYFLGHCDKSPEPSHTPMHKPVMSSQTGEMMPADKLYEGTEVKIALPLSRFDYDVIHRLKAAPRYGRATAPGTETYWDIGSLVQRNGLSFELWMVNEFYNTPNMAAYPNLPIGKYFVCCNMAGTFPKDLGRDAEKALLMIEANWVQAAGGGGNRVCYTSNPKYFAKLPPVG